MTTHTRNDILSEVARTLEHRRAARSKMIEGSGEYAETTRRVERLQLAYDYLLDRMPIGPFEYLDGKAPRVKRA